MVETRSPDRVTGKTAGLPSPAPKLRPSVALRVAVGRPRHDGQACSREIPNSHDGIAQHADLFDGGFQCVARLQKLALG